MKVLDFLAEKVAECAMSHSQGNGGVMTAGVGVNLAYRSYFRAISEIVLGPAVAPALAFEQVIPSLIAKADALAARQGANDAEYIYAVFKLLHRVGASSAAGHASIMRIKDQWKHLRAKFKRHYNPHAHTHAAVATATAVNSNTSYDAVFTGSMYG